MTKLHLDHGDYYGQTGNKCPMMSDLHPLPLMACPLYINLQAPQNFLFFQNLLYFSMYFFHSKLKINLGFQSSLLFFLILVLYNVYYGGVRID